MAPSSTGTDALLDGILEVLLAASAAEGTVTLDEIAEAIGAAPVTYEDVERLIDRLEAAGRRIADPPVNLTTDLRRVIGAARALRQRLGRAPRLGEVAAEAQLSRASVVTALRFARTFG